MKNIDKSKKELLLDLENLQREFHSSKSALKESQDRFLKLVDSSIDGIAIHKAGKLVYVNPSALELIGANSPDELIGRPIIDFVDPGYKQAISKRIQKIQRTEKQAVMAEEIFIRMDGSRVLVEAMGVPVSWNGEPAVQVLFRDISNRKKWEEELALYQYMVSNSTDMLALLDLDFVFLAVNNEYARAFNISGSELIGNNLVGLFGEEVFNNVIKPNALRCLDGEEVNYQAWFDFPAYGRRYMDVTYYPYINKAKEVIGYVANGRNITDQKKAELALFESENRYRTLFEQTADATLIIEDKTFIDCNRATVDMLGYASKEELLQTHPSQLSPPLQEDGRDSFEKANEMMSIAYEKGSHRFEWLHKRQNGEVFPVEVLLTAVPLGEGNFLHVVWRDISLRKQSEKIIMESEARLSESQQLAQIGDFTWDVITGDVSWSKGMYKLLRYDENAKIDLKKVNKEIHHPDDQERVSQWLSDCLSSGSPRLTPNEYRLICKDGNVITVHTEGNIKYIDGKAVSVFGMCMNISENKKAEKKIKALANLEKKKSRQLEESLKQLQRAQEASLNMLNDLNKEIEERKNAKKKIGVYQKNLEQLVESRTLDLQKSQKSLTLLLEDMNESRAELSESNRKLSGLNSDLEAFAYSISHDLRAPLRHIGGFLSILEKTLKEVSPNSQRYFEKINESILNMSNMIDALLSFSRLGRTQIHKSEIDLNTLVKSVVNKFEPEWKDRNFKWEIGKLPTISGDPELLQMVFENLVSNAIKFTSKREKPCIEMGNGLKLKEPCDFYIKDNGAGFDPEYSNKLFEVFQRLHTNEEFEGIGIGLANVKQIIHKHGGSIWADGQIDKGATFYVSLSRMKKQ